MHMIHKFLSTILAQILKLSDVWRQLRESQIAMFKLIITLNKYIAVLRNNLLRGRSQNVIDTLEEENIET